MSTDEMILGFLIGLAIWAFVLLPLKDIAPNWRHPVSGRSLAELLESLPEGQRIRRLEA